MPFLVLPTMREHSLRVIFEAYEYCKTKQNRNPTLNDYTNSDFTVLFVCHGVEIGSLISCGHSNTWGRIKIKCQEF